MSEKLTREFLEGCCHRNTPDLLWDRIEADREAVREEVRAETKGQLRLKYGGDLEDLLEQLFWEFDAEHKKSGMERDVFKGKMRFFAGKFAERVREELLKDHFKIGEEVVLGTGETAYISVTTHYLDEKAIRRPAKKRPMTRKEMIDAISNPGRNIHDPSFRPLDIMKDETLIDICHAYNIPTETDQP